MSAPAALQHPHNKSTSPDSPKHTPPSDHPLPSQNTQSSLSPGSAPSSQDQSHPTNPQDAPQAVPVPTVQFNTPLVPQPNQTESDAVDQQQQPDVKTEGVEPSLNGTNGTIELVEHTPGTIAIEEAVGMSEEASEWVQEGDQMKRVKVRLFLLPYITTPICLWNLQCFHSLGLRANRLTMGGSRDCVLFWTIPGGFRRSPSHCSRRKRL